MNIYEKWNKKSQFSSYDIQEPQEKLSSNQALPWAGRFPFSVNTAQCCIHHHATPVNTAAQYNSPESLMSTAGTGLWGVQLVRNQILLDMVKSHATLLYPGQKIKYVHLTTHLFSILTVLTLRVFGVGISFAPWRPPAKFLLQKWRIEFVIDTHIF